MANQKFKAAINNARFPFLYARAGRSVLQPGLDVAPRTSGAFVGSSENFDYNTVQVLYMENVLPTVEGVSSVTTVDQISAYSPAVEDFDQFITLRDSAELNKIFVPARGKNYVYDEATGLWTSYASFSWASGRTLVTRAYVNGRTFVCYEAARLVEWDPTTPTVATRTVTLPSGYTFADIRGCAGASNYLLLHTDTEVMWSSTLDVLNFNDPIGKSGKQTPIDLKGRITCIVPIAGGFIIYTTRNAVAAFFTNNPDTPFSFREVQGSGGVGSYEQVTSEANQTEHYTFGSNGLQLVNLQTATTILPDCSDFLSSSAYESWDRVNKRVVSTQLSAALSVKLTLLAQRFLVISYGQIAGQFTYALVYDTGLKRWGKIRVDHVDVSVVPVGVLGSLGSRYYELELPYQDYDIAYEDLEVSYGEILPSKAGFAFLQKTGAVKVLVADPAVSDTDGLIIIGRIQLTRGRVVSFNKASFDGVYATPVPTVTVLGSSPGNGKARDVTLTPYVLTATGDFLEVAGKGVFENMDVAVEGRFALSAAVIEVSQHGSR